MTRTRRLASTAPFLEVLEDRIAPANFFINGSGTVVDAQGAEVNVFTDGGASDWAETLGHLGADSAYLFKKGDSLVFDANDNLKADKGESVVLKLTGGAGVFFLSDIDPAAASVEIRQISASDKFGGIVKGVIGEIATNLLPQGKGKAMVYDYTDTIQDAQIRKLTIDGYLERDGEAGDIHAGGGITELIILGASETTKVSVGDIRAGNATEPARYEAFTASPGQAGASINKVRLAGGGNFYAGSGGWIENEESKMAAGKGGSISMVTVESAPSDLTVWAGSGGAATLGKGGGGGSISQFAILGAAGEFVTFQAGSGNSGAAGAGQGGSLSVLTIQGDSVNTLTIGAGDGGSQEMHGGKGRGGQGGSIGKIHIDVPLIQSALIVAGAGGHGASMEAPERGGSGGNGGSVSKVVFFDETGVDLPLSILTSATVDTVAISAGNGGDGFGSGSGGQGGSVHVISVPVSTVAEIVAGDGGSAENHGDRSMGFGKAGAGGNISNLLVIAQPAHGSDSPADINILAGSAGDGGNAAGGSISVVFVLSDHQRIENILIHAGHGSSGLDQSGRAGGAGGSIKEAGVVAPEIGRSAMVAGSGGYGAFAPPPAGVYHSPWDPYSVTKAGGKGGSGGSLTQLVLLANQSEETGFWAGDGGGGAASGSGGNGGSVTNLVLSGFNAQGPAAGTFQKAGVFAGHGGGAYAPHSDVRAKGGNGGHLTDVFSPDMNTFRNFAYSPGEGGEGTDETQWGRNGGYRGIYFAGDW